METPAISLGLACEERLLAWSLPDTGVSLRDKGEHAILLKAFLELIGQAAWRTAHTAEFMNACGTAFTRAPQDKHRMHAAEEEHVALQEHIAPDNMCVNLPSVLSSSAPLPSDRPVGCCASFAIAICDCVFTTWVGPTKSLR